MDSKKVNIILNNLQDLNDLLNGYKFSLVPREGEIKMNFESIEEYDKHRWQSILQKHYFACGCKEGSVTSLVFFFLYWVFVFLFEGVKSIMNWEAWVFSLLFLLIGAVFGKIAGLIYSRYALIIAVRKLILKLSAGFS